MTHHALRRVLLPLAALLLLATLILIAQVETVHGDPPPPVYREASSCTQLAPAGVTWNEFRIDSPTTGTYSTGYLTVNLDVYQLDGEVVFDWQTNLPIDAIYAAGGPGGNLYQYNPPGPPSSGDEALHAPYNGSGKHYYALEMILFCSTSPLYPTPTPPPTPTNTPTATSTPTASPTNTPGPPTATPTQTSTPAPGDTPVPTATAVPTETPSPPSLTYHKFLPLTFRLWSDGEEQNDDWCSAYRIGVNRTYQFLPDDRDDWFTFELAEPADLTVTVDDFQPLAGQVAAYRGPDCTSLELLGNNGDRTSTKELALGTQPAGRYFLYVSNDGVFSTADRYSLTVTARP